MKITARLARWTLLLALSVAAAASCDAESVAAPTASGHREGIERKIFAGEDFLFYSTNEAPDWHGVVMLRKPKTPVIHWYDKCNPVWWLGNDDDSVPPDWYEPDNPHRKRDWFFRNPFTNFTYFVIGVADKDTMRYGRYPKEVGNPHGGWNFAITRRRIIFLPFWDYKNSRMEFYFGWRERGNFGIKLNFHHTPEKMKD